MAQIETHIEDVGQSARAYYGKVFIENFLAAVGQEPLQTKFLNTAIDPRLERMAREAGAEAGIQFRREWLGLDESGE